MTRYNPFTLEVKTILVTGASSGIGREVAIEASRLGAQIVATGRDENRLTETKQNASGQGHISIVADLTCDEDIDRLVGEMPEVDGFVCNAGISHRVPITFMKREDLQRVFDTNVFASMLLTRSLMKNKKVRKNGSLVFVSSRAVHDNTPGNSIYAASKAAIECFAHGCAVEFASRKIRSNAILPGMVETPLIRRNGLLTDEDINKDKERYLLKRYGFPN